MSRLLLAAFLAVYTCDLGAFASPEKSDKLVVHEWGTFTSFQDEEGRAIGGLNNDEEHLPPFVRTIYPDVLSGARSMWSKGAPRAHPDVTMRLETPVLYFHPPTDALQPFAIDVSVDFKGGWLTQFYPGALARAPGLQQAGADFGGIAKSTVGNLTWEKLTVGDDDVTMPETKQRVWTAPRDVNAAPVRSAAGEGERFLFYRGVGNLDAPLKVTRDSSRNLLKINGKFDGFTDANPVHARMPMWLADIRRDGSCAYRTLASVAAQPDTIAAATTATFDEKEYAPGTAGLHTDMRAALIADGLFADEADALLNTWEASYFKTPGLRLFFLVPQKWTDDVLPLKLSRDADVVRTMVGRIEIVTPQQREIIKQIATAPIDAVKNRDDRTMFNTYATLGRFANALLLDEARRRPTPSLATFIKTFQLQPYSLPVPHVAAVKTD